MLAIRTELVWNTADDLLFFIKCIFDGNSLICSKFKKRQMAIFKHMQNTPLLLKTPSNAPTRSGFISRTSVLWQASAVNEKWKVKVEKSILAAPLIWQAVAVNEKWKWKDKSTPAEIKKLKLHLGCTFDLKSLCSRWKVNVKTQIHSCWNKKS